MKVYRWEDPNGELHIVAVAEDIPAACDEARAELARYFGSTPIPEEWLQMLEKEPYACDPPYAETFNLRE